MSRFLLGLLVVVLCICLSAVQGHKKSSKKDASSSSKTFTLTSTKFVEGDMLPEEYTCDGDGVSPPLDWSNAPSDTKQFLLTRSNIYDTDVGATRYDWTVYGISSKTDSIDTDGSTKIGEIGGTFPGIEYEYRSSCSVGEGMKLVTFKIHALNGDLEALVEEKKTCNGNGEQCDVAPYIYGYARDNDMILDTAELNVYYCGGCSDEEIKQYCEVTEVSSKLKGTYMCNNV